ncbi:MAG: hypothetical protein KA956_11230 [Pyrinomonadaceae bacterium]|nr:hypothetical protein [Acidobacteriota bacterium]MBK7933836.1 hypothetical protein [Acidobacteriota bacterium]MBP7377038.1 hypothetical protein [Pyrinomonadaceae bacterium]
MFFYCKTLETLPFSNWNEIIRDLSRPKVATEGKNEKVSCYRNGRLDGRNYCILVYQS